MKKYVFSDTFAPVLVFYTMATRGKSLSPWWSHFEKVDGDFRLVRCLHCNKLVRRGKEGCSTREASNSGMASHMRTKHSGQAVQVVFSTFTLKSENFLPYVQVRLDAAKEAGREVNEDKKDKTVRGSLPLFKLRSKADREAWRKLVFSNCYMTGI